MLLPHTPYRTWQRVVIVRGSPLMAQPRQSFASIHCCTKLVLLAKAMAESLSVPGNGLS
jgi:hypothetical protein